MGGRRTGGGRGKGGKRESKRAEAGAKCDRLICLIQQCVRMLSKTRTQNIFDSHLTSSVTSETSEKTSKRKFALGLKNRLTSGEIVNPFTVATS